MNLSANISGYLVVALWGKHPEKVINMAMSRGIRLWDIYRAEDGSFILKVRLGGYKALRHLVRRSCCRVKIRGKYGMPFLYMRAKKRKILVFGIVFFCAALYVLSSFVWFIEIVGNDKVETERILMSINAHGLKVGVPKSGFDRERLIYRLLLDIPELSWAGIKVEGTKVYIEVAEKTLVSTEDENEPADLVAAADGRIEELLVLTGTPLVKEGDVVKKGQVLIAGVSYPLLEINEDGTLSPSGVPEKVRARGLVRARVVRRLTGECPVKEVIEQDTGNEAKSLVLRWKDREIVLKGYREKPYPYFRVVSEVKALPFGRNHWGPVEIFTITYYEQERLHLEWGLAGAFNEALRRVRDKTLAELPADYRIVKEDKEPINGKDPELVKVRYILETIENIGCYR